MSLPVKNIPKGFSAERTQSHFATYVAREGNASV